MSGLGEGHSLRRLDALDFDPSSWPTTSGDWPPGCGSVTGLGVSLLAGEDTTYYLHNHSSWQDGVLRHHLALEVWPMITLIGLRRRVAREEQPDTTLHRSLPPSALRRPVIVVVMVFLAVAMARRLGAS